ncbi:hypothetical protein LguiA_008122 [Lonicera macranthoides]
MDREGGFNGSSSCYYSVLGIRKDASFSDIRSAYRKLALKWHPDRWTKNPTVAGEANLRFQKIQEAYSVLYDKGKRSMYDAFGIPDDDDEEMGEFMQEMISMMNNTAGAEEESLEDLQRTFVEMFGADLAQNCMENKNQTAKRKARDVASTATASVPKRSSSSFRY